MTKWFAVMLLFVSLVAFGQAPAAKPDTPKQDDKLVLTDAEQAELKSTVMERAYYVEHDRALRLEVSQTQTAIQKADQAVQVKALDILKAHKAEGKYRWDDSQLSFVALPPAPKTEEPRIGFDKSSPSPKLDVNGKKM